MRVSVPRVCSFGLGLLLLMVSVAGTLEAGDVPGIGVPEIDGSAIPAALGILSAGVLMLRARRSK